MRKISLLLLVCILFVTLFSLTSCDESGEHTNAIIEGVVAMLTGVFMVICAPITTLTEAISLGLGAVVEFIAELMF